ncbi:MAG: hypothetical protein Q7R79_02210, partial [bacterium]|nr:hypothetical protein [bacterium]
MEEFFRQIPEDALTPDIIVKNIMYESSDQVIRIAKYVSQLIRTDKIDPENVLSQNFDQLDQSTDTAEQTNTLLFLVCLEGKPSLWEGTTEFLDELKEKYGFTGEFPRPFQRFISQRLSILTEPKTTKGFEDIEDTKKVLELLQQNSEFFYDLLILQEFFTKNVSPVMPLNATWNPELTERFRVRNAAGLWYIYSHNLRSEYVYLMQKNLSSEWTGFNRFAQEPWETLKGKVNTQGNLVDIGSSIGITAVEMAQALDVHGTIILLDYYNPYRNASALRIIDYANPQRRLIPLSEALARMEALRGNRVVIQLFGVDVGKPLTDDIQRYIQNASLVHLGNILPYIPGKKLYPAIANALEAISERGGILKIHNDEILPTCSLLTSLSLQKNG